MKVGFGNIVLVEANAVVVSFVKAIKLISVVVATDKTVEVAIMLTLVEIGIDIM